MPINDEPFLRGACIEHVSGTKYTYEGMIKRSNMWGVDVGADGVTVVGSGTFRDWFHIVGSRAYDSNTLYLEPDAVFTKNYRQLGGWEPDEGQVWYHKVPPAGASPRMVTVRKVVDDIVLYDYQSDDEVHTGVYMARLTDEFLKEFRYGSG